MSLYDQKEWGELSCCNRLGPRSRCLHPAAPPACYTHKQSWETLPLSWSTVMKKCCRSEEKKFGSASSCQVIMDLVPTFRSFRFRIQLWILFVSGNNFFYDLEKCTAFCKKEIYNYKHKTFICTVSFFQQVMIISDPGPTWHVITDPYIPNPPWMKG